MFTRKSLLGALIFGIVALGAAADAYVGSATRQGTVMSQKPKTANQQGTAAAFALPNRTPEVTGSWMLEIEPTPATGLPPKVVGLITFDEGGGCVETIILPPVTPAHGTWVRTGRREFVFVIVHHLVDPQGNFVGTVKVKSNATFIGKDRFHAEFEGSLFDPNGNVIAPVSGTERGTRITPESL